MAEELRSAHQWLEQSKGAHMQTLINQIRDANLAYSSGNPYLTDTEYDELWKKLHAADPSNPHLYHTSHDPNIPGDHIRHISQIMGTNKAFDMEDLKPFLTRFKSQTLVIEPKYDGVAAMIYRDKNGYHKYVLHGDGVHGRDISIHRNNITAYNELRSHDSVELIIPNNLWLKDYGKNPRNTVAGWLNSSKIPHADVVRAVSHNNGGTFHRYEHNEDLETLLLSLYAKWSTVYPMDGLMLKVADEKARLVSGHNGTASNWSIAWKPPIQTKKTRVVDIHWNVSRNGRVIPKVEYEPIELCGTTNRFATANNAAWLRDKRIFIGSYITVGKAGEIIPKILEVDNSGLPEIHTYLEVCPVCGNKLTWSGADLMCLAESCIVKLSKRLAYFYSDKGMDVKSIGEAMIMELLYDPQCREVLASSPWALLSINSYGLRAKLTSIWGETRTNKLMVNVAEVSTKKNPAQFIAALGFPGLAYKTAVKLMQQLAGAGSKSHTSKKALNNFVEALSQLTRAKNELVNFSLAPMPAPALVTYCITGELSTARSEMISYLTEKRWQFSNQVSKFTDVLILGVLKRETTKLQKAKTLGVQIIDETQLPEFIRRLA
jgi:NAD-dependent DNA ligase